MTDYLADLPEQIRERFQSLLRFNDDGSWDCPDPRAFVAFVVENAEAHPVLLNFIQVDEDRLIQHVRETGEVPPGVKIIKTTETEGDNVTQVRIFNGPATIPESER